MAFKKGQMVNESTVLIVDVVDELIKL